MYLKLGWKHSVSCVSRTSQTRNTHHRRESTCCPYTISRRIARAHSSCPRRASRRTNGQQQLGHELVLGLGSGRDAAGTPETVGVGVGVGRWRHRRLPTTSLCSVGRQTYTCTLTSVYFVPVYLAVYLVCICFQDRNTQIHAYPHPSPSVSNI